MHDGSIAVNANEQLRSRRRAWPTADEPKVRRLVVDDSVRVAMHIVLAQEIRKRTPVADRDRPTPLLLEAPELRNDLVHDDQATVSQARRTTAASADCQCSCRADLPSWTRSGQRYCSLLIRRCSDGSRLLAGPVHEGVGSCGSRSPSTAGLWSPHRPPGGPNPQLCWQSTADREELGRRAALSQPAHLACDRVSPQ